MKYAVVFEKAEHNWAAYVPDLPGCVTTGTTLEDTRRLIGEAIAFHVWPSTILIWSYSEDGLPKPPSDDPHIDPNLLAKQLATVRETTKLGVHKEPRIPMKNDAASYSEVDVPNEWAVVYGSVIGSPNLRKACGDEIGCGGFRGAPIAIIVDPKNIHVLNGERH